MMIDIIHSFQYVILDLKVSSKWGCDKSLKHIEDILRTTIVFRKIAWVLIESGYELVKNLGSWLVDDGLDKGIKGIHDGCCYWVE